MRSSYVVHDRVTIECGESLAHQSFKAECDINTIMKKFEKTGILSHTSRYQGRYEDVALSVDYQEALETVRMAEEAFSTLPASIRKRFENSPEAFLAFVEDPANAEEVQKLGLGKKPLPAEQISAPKEPVPTPDADGPPA